MKYKQGNMYWNELNGRIGVRYEDGTEDDGLHCGATMQALVKDKWIDTRLEYADNEWFLTGLYAPGKIPIGQIIRKE
jgi:hypothetical protein